MAVLMPRIFLGSLLGLNLGWKGTHLLNDSVMGGNSTGTFAAGKSLLWHSHLIPENGGFASIRCPLSGMEEETSAFVFETTGGGGATFEFRAHTIAAGEIAYYSTFQTYMADAADVKQQVTIRLCDMIPRRRGRIVLDAPPLVARDVDEVGFMITKAGGQRGDYSLNIKWVGAI